jgi:uncharacterized LabA/DUF88 family protein
MNDHKEKVIVYIDGFNLYFGMTSKFTNIKWLNIWELAEDLLKPHQELVDVKYFTSMVSNNTEKEQRQRTYISALRTTNTKIIFGHYKSRPKTCKSCGHSWRNNEEKMTDVNIAVNMLVDAIHNRYDKALLISGDSDLVPPIKAIHSNFPEKKVVVAFPPNRHNNSVKNVAKGSFILGRTKFTKNQFPDSIKTVDGFTISRPKKW